MCQSRILGPFPDAESMPMDDNAIIDILLKYEGGFVNNSADHGGATNFGITAADFGRWKKLGRVASVAEVKAMTVDDARAIYQAWYIDAPGFNAITDGSLKLVLVDSGVLHGTRTAVRWLQQALGVTPDGVIGNETTTALASRDIDVAKVARQVLSTRIRRYGAIVAGEASQLTFLVGWLNRATDMLVKL
jgi:lysozyme family protein